MFGQGQGCIFKLHPYHGNPHGLIALHAGNIHNINAFIFANQLNTVGLQVALAVATAHPAEKALNNFEAIH